MTVPPDTHDYNQGSGTEPTRSINAGRLWTGGVATALVGALVAVVGVLIARGLFDVPVLAPSSEGSFGNASTFRLAGLAAGAALLATGLLHLLLVSTPRPGQFFTWIVALVTIAVDNEQHLRGAGPSPITVGDTAWRVRPGWMHLHRPRL